jgi:predicted Rossmann-fold nucleotide-binding protein
MTTTLTAAGTVPSLGARETSRRRHAGQPVHLRVISITGSRNGVPSELQWRALYQLGSRPGTHLLHGGAPGIDRAVAERARRLTCWVVSEVPADWTVYGGYAGPLRNSILVRAADFLVSFGGGRGTANCMRQALEHGTPVVDLSALA